MCSSDLILVMPKSEKLTVSYGGFSMGDMLLGITDLSESEVLNKTMSIELRDRISVVAPKLIAMTTVDGTSVGVVGVRWEKEKILKGYWAVNGDYPTIENGVIVGSKAAARLNLAPGAPLDLGGNPVIVTGVLMPTGSDDD